MTSSIASSWGDSERRVTEYRRTEEAVIELRAAAALLRLRLQVEVLESSPDTEMLAQLVGRRGIDLDEGAAVVTQVDGEFCIVLRYGSAAFFRLGRSIGSLTKYQGMGDIYRIFLGAQKDGLDFNLAYIPETFQATSKERFDPAYMRALFDFGYQLALNGYPWIKNPVELAPPVQ